MKSKQLALFLLIVFAPLAAIAWLGVRMLRTESEVLENRYRDVFSRSMRSSVEAKIDATLKIYSNQLRSLPAASTLSVEELRTLARRHPLILQTFVLDADGALRYPNPDGPTTQSEDAFLARAAEVFRRGEIPRVRIPQGEGGPSGSSEREGWYSWHFGSGMRFLYYWETESGAVVGAEINRSRLLADIILNLDAETGGSSDRSVDSGRTVLIDSSGEAVIAFGKYQPVDGEVAFATVALHPPFSGWRVDHYAKIGNSALGDAASRTFTAALLAFMLTAMIGAAAVYFYAGHVRELREAGQRVSFVNQVSHELKTPLTNIRMYAELLREDLSEDDETSRRHLDVLVDESHRLSRLIANVLTFSRGRRQALQLNPKSGDIDDTVRTVLANFAPSFAAKGIESRFEGGVTGPTHFDADALEQILGNLLSNVEKYCRSGDAVAITSSHSDGIVEIVLEDTGPGIASDERARVFEPFYRSSNKLTDGVAGTGIGLSIARELARLHDGDLTLLPAVRGATFRVTLDVSGEHS